MFSGQGVAVSVAVAADAETIIVRVTDQNGTSQACYIVEIYHSGRNRRAVSYGLRITIKRM